MSLRNKAGSTSGGGAAPVDGPHPDPAAEPVSLVIDSTGKRCPIPILDLARQIVGVPVGAVLLVLADDPAATADIPAWCRLRGHEYLGPRAGPSVPGFAVRRLH